MSWLSFDPAAYAVGDPLYVEDGNWDYTITEYTVDKITPSGQIVASRTYENGHKDEIRLTKAGRLSGVGQWSRRHVVDALRAAETRRDMATRQAWHGVRKIAEDLTKAAAQRDPDALCAAMGELRNAASAIETQRAKTAGLGPQDESATPKVDAQPLVAKGETNRG